MPGFYTIGVLTIGILISSAIYSQERIVGSDVSTGPAVIMPVGNSITFDCWTNDTRSIGEKASYRFVLWDSLRTNNYDFDFTGSQSSGFDIFPDYQHEGHPGWRDDQIATNIYAWLQEKPNTNIILLHIGTNEVDTSSADIRNILDEVDRFEYSYNKDVWVILAKIINRVPYNSVTTFFNANIEKMAKRRISNGDKIIIVDMENGAGLNYNICTEPPFDKGDFYNELHPNPSGYKKMASVWYNALKQILPDPSPREPYITTSASISAIAGQSYTYDIDASGTGAPEYSLESHPPGMKINKYTGRINWSPAVPGNYYVSVRAKNSSGSSFQRYSIAVGSPECPDNIISYWNLDETSSSSYSDLLGVSKAYPGESAPVPVLGIVGGAQQFNGVNTQINVPPNPAFDFSIISSFSVEFWYLGWSIPAKTKSAVARYISETGGGWAVGINANDGNARFFISDGRASSVVQGKKIIDGKWHHVAVSRNGGSGSLNIYVDGELNASANKFFSTGFSSSTDYINIGGLLNQSTASLQGILDEVAIYSKELSAGEIQQHYFNGLNGSGYCESSQGLTAPRIISAPVISGIIGHLYEYEVNAKGTPAPIYSLTNSPPDMTIDCFTGVIHWIPSRMGRYNVIIVASNGVQPNCTQTFTINRITRVHSNFDYSYIDLLEDAGIPDDHQLFQNYPNPFNSVTNIEFAVPDYSAVKINIYDQLGREISRVVNGFFDAGRYKIIYDAGHLAGGVYYYQMESGGVKISKKLLLLK